MGALPQALEIIFEVQMKGSNEKIIRKKKSFPNFQNVFFFSSEPFLLSNLITFLFFIHFKQFKML
jgi:hypothetical protein